VSGNVVIPAKAGIQTQGRCNPFAVNLSNHEHEKYQVHQGKNWLIGFSLKYPFQLGPAQ